MRYSKGHFNDKPKTKYTMTTKSIPSFKDTKVVLKRIKEYSGRWLKATETLFFDGKPSKDKITDTICNMCSKGGNVIIDADFEICEVTLNDYAQFF